jgi:heme/copper-type cytochrome/quinol oxidase subunit 1
MWKVYGGGLALVAGITAFFEAHSHRPVPAGVRMPGWTSYAPLRTAARLSQTSYDLVRIGAWALVILGAVTVVLRLAGYVRPT